MGQPEIILQVDFRTKKLKQRYLRSDEAIRAWGAKVGRKYIELIIRVEGQVVIVEEVSGHYGD